MKIKRAIQIYTDLGLDDMSMILRDYAQERDEARYTMSVEGLSNDEIATFERHKYDMNTRQTDVTNSILRHKNRVD